MKELCICYSYERVMLQYKISVRVMKEFVKEL